MNTVRLHPMTALREEQLRLLATRRHHDEARQLTDLRVCKIHRAILGDDSVASTLVGWHLSNRAELAGRIDSGYREPRRFSCAYIQSVGGLRVVEIIHTVAGVDG